MNKRDAAAEYARRYTDEIVKGKDLKTVKMAFALTSIGKCLGILRTALNELRPPSAKHQAALDDSIAELLKWVAQLAEAGAMEGTPNPEEILVLADQFSDLIHDALTEGALVDAMSKKK